MDAFRLCLLLPDCHDGEDGFWGSGGRPKPPSQDSSHLPAPGCRFSPHAMTGSSTSFSRGTSSGSRTKTGNLQGTDFTDPGKEREKEGRKEKEIKKSQFPVKGSSSELYGKCCPFLCKIPQDVLLIWQSSVNYICTQLNFLRQSNLRIASFVNHSFSSAALHPSTFPIPSSFPRLCSLRWARFPKGVIAALPGETHSRHSRRLTSLKPAKMTNSWRRKGTHTEMLQLSHLLILEEIGVV